MAISRRSFLASVAAVAGTSCWARGTGRPNVTFGVVSDVHLNKAGDEDTFLKVLAFFRDQGADGVMIAGDIADTGQVAQLERAAACWRKTFPNGKAPDGRAVEQLWVYGNHDIQGWSWGTRYRDEADKRARAIGYSDNAARVWARVMGEPYHPIWAKVVKGYTFIGAHWGHEKELDAFLQANAAKLNLQSKRPFFYAQHPHPADTVQDGWARGKEKQQGRWAWGNDGGVATKALAKFPNAVAFSGHSHYSLTDERSIWQGSFTSIGTSSLRYIFSQYWRDNGEGHNGIDKQMAMLPEQTGRQGMLIRVYDDAYVIERREFVYGEKLGPDWVVPLDGTRPFAFEPRAEKRTAPSFAAGARVTVTRHAKGRNRAGKPADQVVVEFPAAQASVNARVHDYEVTAFAYHQDVDYPIATKRVLAETYFLAPERDRGVKAAKIVFNVKELKGAKSVVFAVRPLECFGRKGAEIYSDVVTL